VDGLIWPPIHKRVLFQYQPVGIKVLAKGDLVSIVFVIGGRPTLNLTRLSSLPLGAPLLHNIISGV
jgi:hypothetical protein